MTRYRPLDPTRHGTVQMRPTADARAMRYAWVGLSEVPLASADFPLCVAKDGETGRFTLVALLSLDQPRNLYWRDGGWRCTYVPDAVMAEGFRLDAGSALGLLVDEDSDRFAAPGQPLFGTDGAPTAAVEAMRVRLRRLVADLNAAHDMVDGFVQLDLVRALEVVLRLPNGAEHEVSGLYTLSPSALAELPDPMVVDLFRKGHLAAATLIAASVNQMERLLQLRGAEQGDGGRPDLHIRLVDHTSRP
ncbi:SapC family protein [Nitrospirillum sp. BR 11163]|uniref:SapC family protein n=1 Tax=Nitrospirillum sp. BR 11163 TaxID=3104323 RepID=UPI002AFEFA21|nr:SapC family protein [Nitrospirillum sp. BR 11163]MEA1674514.1 SapC family protein [Nitrospirillum sp. BR 11163]